MSAGTQYLVGVVDNAPVDVEPTDARCTSVDAVFYKLFGHRAQVNDDLT